MWNFQGTNRFLRGGFDPHIIIYYLLRGKKENLARIIVANFITSLMFAIYHCDIKSLLVFNVEQILSIIPLFFLGVGIAYVQEKTSNISCSIVTHIVINLISISWKLIEEVSWKIIV